VTAYLIRDSGGDVFFGWGGGGLRSGGRVGIFYGNN
jgi:hypothetical protein